MTRSDKWKIKSWYAVIAPKLFDERKIGDVLSIDDESLIDRIVSVNLGELTGELPHSYTQVHFRISDVKGKTAYTKMIGHELIRSYVRTIIRRRMSLVDDVVDVKTKDNVEVRVKYAIVTASKVSGDVRATLRKIAKDLFLQNAAKQNYDNFIQEILFKKAASQVYNEVKKIVPIKKVEVIKTELIESKKAAS